MDTHFLRGHRALDCGQTNSAFRLFLVGAKSWDESCQQVLGYLYDEGIGVKANDEQAAFWYSLACTVGRSSAAAYNLSLLYKRNGYLDLAGKYMRRAAELGDAEAVQEVRRRVEIGSASPRASRSNAEAAKDDHESA